MPTRNMHWYNQNEGISYPLDDTATCADSNGGMLPSNIITDLNLRWPKHLGDYAFVSSVSVTPSLVTVTLQVANTLDDTDFAPLAVVSVVKPVSQGRMYKLQPQVDGVGGWIVFGSGVDDKVPYRGRFQMPTDGLLTPRAARPYTPLPLSSVGVLNQATALSGIIRLIGEDPLVIAKEERTIEGVVRDCIVVRLTDGAGADGFPVPIAASKLAGFTQESAFQQFAGPCAGRPESGTCGTPEPIEFINAVAPDCDGVITLEFSGCATVTKIDPECGIVIDCGVGLTDACIPPHIPSSAGLLPNEYTPANIPDYQPPDPPPTDPGVSESSVVVGGLPFTDCFSDGSGNWTTRAGAWALGNSDDSPEVMCPEDEYYTSESASGSISHHVVKASYDTTTAATRNVTVWQGFDEYTVFRRVLTDVKLIAGPTGALHNAGLVLNFRPSAAIPTQRVYFLAEIDWESQQFRISRFNGTTFQVLAPVTVPGIQLGKWYRIDVSVVAVGTNTQISARLTSITDPGATDVTITYTTSTYAPSNGWFGLGTNRALASFAYMRVEVVDG